MSPESIESNIRHGNHLYTIQEYQSAIKIFDIVTKNSKDLEVLVDAWNNKAQCFRMLGQHRKELHCINKALDYRIRPEFLSNKILALESLGRRTETVTIRNQLVELQKYS